MTIQTEYHNGVWVPTLDEMHQMSDLELLHLRTQCVDAADSITGALQGNAVPEDKIDAARSRLRRLNRGLGGIKNILIERRSAERQVAFGELLDAGRAFLADDCDPNYERLETAVRYFDRKEPA